MPAQPGTSKVFPNVAGARKPIGGKRVFVLRALDNMKRLGKTPRGPGVIEVQRRFVIGILGLLTTVSLLLQSDYRKAIFS
jgi:hypothetical protein